MFSVHARCYVSRVASGIETPDAEVVGARLRLERERRSIGLREFARRLGVSPSLISQIETGKSSPSVATLYAMVTELGISLDDLLLEHGTPSSERAPRGFDPVQRRGDRSVIVLDSGVRWERLTATPDQYDFLEVEYPPGAESAAEHGLMRHLGREYGVVLAGRLGVQLGFERHELEPGDSIAFDSTTPHRLWTIGDAPARAIWFVIGRQGDRVVWSLASLDAGQSKVFKINTRCSRISTVKNTATVSWCSQASAECTMEIQAGKG